MALILLFELIAVGAILFLLALTVRWLTGRRVLQLFTKGPGLR